MTGGSRPPPPKAYQGFDYSPEALAGGTTGGSRPPPPKAYQGFDYSPETLGRGGTTRGSRPPPPKAYQGFDYSPRDPGIRRGPWRLADRLVAPRARGRSRDRQREGTPHPIVGGPDYAQQLERQKTAYAMARLARSTRESYDRLWHRWELYRGLQQRSPYVPGETRSERMRDEEDLIGFAI